MFEDEKIDFIESLPEADAILVVWVKLLTMAGRNNANGFIFLTEQIPYTPEMLAHRFRRPLNTIKLALETLRSLGMIGYTEDGFLTISNWEKHQNIEGMERIREQTRLRVAKYRENKKLLEDGNVTSSVTVTEGNETEEELELDKEETYLSQISNLRARYSLNDLQIIDEYFDILRWTRKNGKIADSVIRKIYQEWEKFSIPKVIHALKVYTNNPRHHDKKENYCYGIMRNTNMDEIENSNKQVDDPYAGMEVY